MKNRVWVVEGLDPRTKRWCPVYGLFYYSKKEARENRPKNGYCRYDGIRKYRVAKYESGV